MLRNMLAPEFSEFWSQEDEANLSAEWRQDEMRRSLLNVSGNAIGELLVLWRTMVQYYKCFPTQIVSREYYLVYSPMRSKKGEVGEVDSPAWASTFCTPLSRILFHPLWDEGHNGPLIMMLQFAVIVRTDDRRTWDLENPTSSLFIEAHKQA